MCQFPRAMVLLILVGVFQVQRIHCKKHSVQILVEKKPSNNAGFNTPSEVHIDYITHAIKHVVYSRFHIAFACYFHSILFTKFWHKLQCITQFSNANEISCTTAPAEQVFSKAAHHNGPQLEKNAKIKELNAKGRQIKECSYV